MFPQYLMLVIGYCVITSEGYKSLNKSCDDTSCYYLYRAGNSHLTWDKAKAACNEEGLEMSRIESSQAQSTVEELLQDLAQDTERKVWIGGRRSPDDTWRYVNGTEFSGKGNISTSHGENYTYCSHVKVCKPSYPKYTYTGDNCDEKQSHAKVLCQYDPPARGNCSSADVRYGDKCYNSTPYQLAGEDWYDAETCCTNSDIPGHIAYSYLDDINSTNNIINLLAGENGCIHLWLGVRRRAWFWMTAENRTVSYFNWHDDHSSSDGDCMYIDVNKQNKRMSQSCTDLPLKYFLCMHERDTLTTTSIDIATNTTNTSINEVSNKFKPGYTAAIVVVVVVVILAVVIGLTVFFVLKRRKQTSKDHCYVNEDFHHSSGKGGESLEPEYADINPDVGGNDGDEDDVINPYDVKHIEAPSGDLYALSSNQVNKTKGDINKNKDVKSRKKNQKSKSSGTKHTEHFETPSGDVYAQVVK